MITKDLKSTKGITLISLVVSIVVMLILAGVSIVTLTGDNGLLNQVQNARKATTLATMEEELNLVYMSIYTEKTQTGAINSSVSLDEIYEYDKLSSETKNHIIQLGGVSSISFVNQNQSTNIALLTEANAITKAGTVGTNIVSIQVKEESDSNSYWLESDGIYYPMSVSNSRVTLDKENKATEEPTGEGELGSGIEVKFIDSGVSEQASTSSFVEKNVSKSGNITTITLTATEAGSTHVIVKNGDIALNENINVTVSPVYAINIGQMEHGSIRKITGGHDTTDYTKFENEAVVQLNAIGATTPTRYTFEKWNDDNSTTNPKEITISSVIPNVTYTATFVEFKLYGAQVRLNGGNPIIVKGSNTIDDNWKLFYIDDVSNGYVHLIYGNYYPTDVQTDPDTESVNTINLTPVESFPWGVNSESSRLNLLRYLKNNTSYEEENLDLNTPVGEKYDSWTNLATALTIGNGKVLKGKTIQVQGAPNITMWVNSWNEQGYTELILKDSGNPIVGYYIGKKVSEGEQTYSENVSLVSEKGHDDKLYFTSNVSYYLSSPIGSWNARMSAVDSNASVGGCAYYSSGGVAARPVVSILKSDFQELFPNISIEK